MTFMLLFAAAAAHAQAGIDFARLPLEVRFGVYEGWERAPVSPELMVLALGHEHVAGLKYSVAVALGRSPSLARDRAVLELVNRQPGHLDVALVATCLRVPGAQAQRYLLKLAEPRYAQYMKIPRTLREFLPSPRVEGRPVQVAPSDVRWKVAQGLRADLTELVTALASADGGWNRSFPKLDGFEDAMVEGERKNRARRPQMATPSRISSR